MTDPAMPPTITLQYRTAPSGRTHAAYLGNCRVGYVEQRELTGAWIWQSIFLRPTGGAYFGKESDEGSAKLLLEMSVHHWLAEAGLQQRKTSNDVPSTESAAAEPRDHRQDADDQELTDEPSKSVNDGGAVRRGDATGGKRGTRSSRRLSAKSQRARKT